MISTTAAAIACMISASFSAILAAVIMSALTMGKIGDLQDELDRYRAAENPFNEIDPDSERSRWPTHIG